METDDRIVKAILAVGALNALVKASARLGPEHRAATIGDVVVLTMELEAAIFPRESERERSIHPHVEVGSNARNHASETDAK
jgi:hypothetical protein